MQVGWGGGGGCGWGGGHFDHAGVQRRHDNVDLQRLRRKQRGTGVGQLLRLLSARDRAPGCHDRRPALASQPLGPRRPAMAMQAWLSTALRHDLQQADFMRGGVKGVHALLERGWLLCDPIQPPDEAVVACRSRSAAIGQIRENWAGRTSASKRSPRAGRAGQQSSPRARWAQPVIRRQWTVGRTV